MTAEAREWPGNGVKRGLEKLQDGDTRMAGLQVVCSLAYLSE